MRRSRRVALVAGVAALAVAATATPLLRLTAHAGTQETAPPPPPPPVVTVMPLGDSITWGYTKRHGTPVAVNGYREDLRERLRREGMNVDYVGSCPRPAVDRWNCSGKNATMTDGEHEGHSGFRIHQLAAFATEWMNRYKPQVVLLMAGTNDVGKADRASAPARLSYLIDRIRDARPSAHIFVATIPQRRDGAAAFVTAYNNTIPGIVRSKDDHVHLVPQHIVGRDPRDLVDDGVHPTDCGYAKISFVWYYTMERHLAPGQWDTGYYPWSNKGVCA